MTEQLSIALMHTLTDKVEKVIAKMLKKECKSSFRFCHMQCRMCVDGTIGIDYYEPEELLTNDRHEKEMEKYYERFLENRQILRRNPNIAQRAMRNGPFLFNRCQDCSVIVLTDREINATMRSQNCSTAHSIQHCKDDNFEIIAQRLNIKLAFLIDQ